VFANGILPLVGRTEPGCTLVCIDLNKVSDQSGSWDCAVEQDGEANATVQQAVFGVLSNAVRHTGLLAMHEPRQEAEEAVGFGGNSGIVTLSEEAFREALTAFIEGTLWACVLSVQSAVGEGCGVDARSRLSSARMRINVVLGPLPRFQVRLRCLLSNPPAHGRLNGFPPSILSAGL